MLMEKEVVKMILKLTFDGGVSASDGDTSVLFAFVVENINNPGGVGIVDSTIGLAKKHAAIERWAALFDHIGRSQSVKIDRRERECNAPLLFGRLDNQAGHLEIVRATIDAWRCGQLQVDAVDDVKN